ncbi:MAG: helix-turn-helix domain-containing protein [Pseudomonadota bacterium]
MTGSPSFVPALMKARDAAHYLGVSVTKLGTLDIPRRVHGGNRLYDRQDLDAWIASLPYEEQEDSGCQDADRRFGVSA